MSPKEILAQSAEATETEASGEKLTTNGRSCSIRWRLSLNCSRRSFPPLAPTNVRSRPVFDASCSTSRYLLEVASTSWPSFRSESMTGLKKRTCFGVKMSIHSFNFFHNPKSIVCTLEFEIESGFRSL